MTRYPNRRPRASFRARRFNPNNPAERVLIVLVMAVVIGITIGLVLPRFSRPVAQLTGQQLAKGPAVDVLKTLDVDDAQRGAGYDRDSFGYRETDDDGNGCDVRDDVLARDLQQVTYTGCHVKTGVLSDPYTAKTIRFTRGSATSAAVQIDHVVALENAWQSGASSWNTAERYRFGNDSYNMLAVDGPTNEQKGSASAAYWLPTNGEYRCAYVARQIGVKEAYGLTVSNVEKQAMMSVLRSCPNQEIPQR